MIDLFAWLAPGCAVAFLVVALVTYLLRYGWLGARWPWATSVLSFAGSIVGGGLIFGLFVGVKAEEFLPSLYLHASR